MKKNLRIIKGVLLHPFKALYFVYSGKRKDYTILQEQAEIRAINKAFYRSLYLSSLTDTLNLRYHASSY